MADKNEELVKKELLMILKLNSKLNYQRSEEIKKMYAAITERKMFRTPLGLKYMKRLEQIGGGEDISKKCILCAGDLDNHSLICTKCIRKYHALQFQEKKGDSVRESKDRQRQPSGAAGQSSETKNNPDTFSPVENKKTDEDSKEESLKESLRKKGLILGIIIVALWIINELIGLGNVFAFCTIVTLCVFIYKCVRKQEKRNTIIAFAVFFLLAGVFGGTGGNKSNDVANMLGKTEKQVWKEWGEPDYIDTQGRKVYNEEYCYKPSGGKITWVTLGERDKNETLKGISIGDSEEAVNKIMKRKGAVLDESVDKSALFGTDAAVYIMDDMVIIVYFNSAGTVRAVDALLKSSAM